MFHRSKSGHNGLFLPRGKQIIIIKSHIFWCSNSTSYGSDQGCVIDVAYNNCVSSLGED